MVCVIGNDQYTDVSGITKSCARLQLSVFLEVRRRWLLEQLDVKKKKGVLIVVIVDLGLVGVLLRTKSSVVYVSG